MRPMSTHSQKNPAWAPALKGVEVVNVEGYLAPAVLWRDDPRVSVADFAFRRMLEESPRLSGLLAELERRELRFSVFGGWLRDTLSASSHCSTGPRDVDLVVEGAELDVLLEILPTDVSPTLFGGVQSSASPVAFDIWPLHETYLIKVLHLRPTFENLLRTADFNINAGLFFPQQRGEASKIMDAGMAAALERGQIAFNAAELPFPVLQCARLIAYAAKLDFVFSPDVRQFVSAILEEPGQRAEVLKGLARHQPDLHPTLTGPIISALTKGSS